MCYMSTKKVERAREDGMDIWGWGGIGVFFLAAFKQIHLEGGPSVVKELFSFSACKKCVMYRKIGFHLY